MESKFLISVNYSFNVIKDSCRENITGDINIYLHGCNSLLVPECAVCVYMCVCVCDIKSEYQKKSHYVSDLSKLDTSLHETQSTVLQVPRLNRCRSIISLSKITSNLV